MVDLLFFAFEEEDAARPARLERASEAWSAPQEGLVCTASSPCRWHGADVRSCTCNAPSSSYALQGRPRRSRLLRRSEARPQSRGRPRRHHPRLAADGDRHRRAPPPRPEALARGRDRRLRRERDERRLALGRRRDRRRKHPRGGRGRLPAPRVLPGVLRSRAGRGQVRLRLARVVRCAIAATNGVTVSRSPTRRPASPLRLALAPLVARGRRRRAARGAAHPRMGDAAAAASSTARILEGAVLLAALAA